MGLVKYLGGAGIAIPGRVAVVGFDDYDWTEIANPPITAVRQSAFAMGAKGAEMLIGLIEGARAARTDGPPARRADSARIPRPRAAVTKGIV